MVGEHPAQPCSRSRAACASGFWSLVDTLA
jgi:hypothetical protein